MGHDDDRLTRADALEDQARTETLARARELGAEAARLRMQVLGEKPYPVLACSECWQLTGWLGSGDRCDVCISSARREAAFADPHGSFLNLASERSDQSRTRAAVWKRWAAAVGVRGPLERERVAAWDDRVEPDETGPSEPEDAFVIFDSDRGEWPAPEGDDVLVRFSTLAYRFENAGWRRINQTGGPTPLTPHVFPASLPMEQLAEAWSDYRGEVRAYNAAIWTEEAARREQERQAAKARAEAEEEQSGTSTLLD
jgi:hypothetical protein